MINTIIHGCCLEVMKDIPDRCIDMILCDLPYGVTSRNKWDVCIDIVEYFKLSKEKIKENGVIVLTAIEPFSSKLIVNNDDIYKYSWVWKKQTATGFLNAKKQPLRCYENVLVFYNKQCTYNPIMTTGHKQYKIKGHKYTDSKNYGKHDIPDYVGGTTRYPQNIINIKTEPNRKANKLHPTQKPVALMEYLIRTYTNENDLILDNCVGSGTTAVACINTNRNFIGIEKEKKYVDIANNRIKEALERRTTTTIRH